MVGFCLRLAGSTCTPFCLTSLNGGSLLDELDNVDTSSSMKGTLTSILDVGESCIRIVSADSWLKLTVLLLAGFSRPNSSFLVSKLDFFESGTILLDSVSTASLLNSSSTLL